MSVDASYVNVYIGTGVPSYVAIVYYDICLMYPELCL